MPTPEILHISDSLFGDAAIVNAYGEEPGPNHADYQAALEHIREAGELGRIAMEMIAASNGEGDPANFAGPMQSVFS